MIYFHNPAELLKMDENGILAVHHFADIPKN